MKFGAAPPSSSADLQRGAAGPLGHPQNPFVYQEFLEFLLASLLPEAPLPPRSGSGSIIKRVSSRITVRDDRPLAPSLSFPPWIWPKR